MANKLLLPGFGGQYTSETFASVSVASLGADLIDCSRCAQLSISVNSTTPTGLAFNIQQSFNGGITFTPLGSTITAVANTLFDVTDGPFGQIQIGSVAITTGTFNVRITGFPMQRMF